MNVDRKKRAGPLGSRVTMVVFMINSNRVVCVCYQSLNVMVVMITNDFYPIRKSQKELEYYIG